MRDTTQYRHDGKRLLSVTEVLHLAGMIDFAGIPRETLERAAARGRRAHQEIRDALSEYPGAPLGFAEDALRTMLELRLSTAVGYAKAALMAVRDLRLLTIHSEVQMTSPELLLCGTADLLSLDNDRRVWVIDWKTGSPQDWHGLQLTGYALLDQRSSEQDSVRLALASVYVRDSGDYTVRMHKPDHMFAAALQVARWRMEHIFKGKYDDLDARHSDD
jgi:hypothetical protein